MTTDAVDLTTDVKGQPSAAEVEAAVLGWFDRHRWWVFTGIAVLYLVTFNARWRLNPDSALYMELGRNVAEGKGYTYHGEPHTWYEPGLPWVIAGLYRVFGVESYAPVLAFILACSAAGLWLTYRLMLGFAGRPTAVLVTALVAVCETFLRYGYQVVSDTPFFVGVMLYLLGWERVVNRKDPRRRSWSGWLMIAGSVVIMAAFRPTVITFIGAVVLASAWKLVAPPKWGGVRAGRRVLVGVVLLTVACYAGFRKVDPRRHHGEQSVYREATLKSLLTERRGYAIHRMLTETVPDFVGEIFPEAVIGTRLGPGLDWIASAAMLAAGLALVTTRPLWAAWIAATVAQSMFWLPRERYTVPIMPLLLYAVWRAAVRLGARAGPKWAAWLVGGVLVIFVVPNTIMVVRFAIEQRHAGVNGDGRGDPQLEPFVKMGREINRVVAETDAVVAHEGRILSYFSRRRVDQPLKDLRWPPTAEQERRFEDSLTASPALYVVLPDEGNKKNVEGLMKDLGMAPGEVLASVERPKDRKRRAQAPLELRKLNPK